MDSEFSRQTDTDGTRCAYPVFLDVTDRLCVVVGGGRVAKRKVEKLLAAGARVRVVSPRLDERMATWVQADRVEHIPRAYRPGDLDGAWLVFAATDDPEVNRAVAEEAARNRQFVNVADRADACSFIVPALVEHGTYRIAISTSGHRPAEAKRLRESLTEDIVCGTNRFVARLRQGKVPDTGDGQRDSVPDASGHVDGHPSI